MTLDLPRDPVCFMSHVVATIECNVYRMEFSVKIIIIIIIIIESSGRH